MASRTTRSDIPVYLAALALSFLLVGLFFGLQVALVLKQFHPSFALVPVALALAIGLLLGRATVLRRRLDEQRELFRAVADSAAELSYYRRSDGTFLYVSPSATRLTGYPPAAFYADPDLLGRLVHPEDRALWEEHLRHADECGPDESLELRIHTRDGELRWIQHLCTGVRDSQGRLLGVRSANIDITDRRRSEERAWRLAHYDPLTDLPNRRYLEAQLETCVTRSAGSGELFGVLFLDLDRFNHVNDTLGHAFGDRLLRQVAERLRDQGTGRLAGRFGGDEFVVLTPPLAHPDDARAQARHLLHLLEAPFELEGQRLYLSGSVGIALYPHDGPDAGTLIKHADAAVYRAKQEGGERIHYFTPELAHRVSGFLELENRLRQAIERDELVVHYQPRVDLASARMVGCEALVRWRREGQLVYPGEFISVAEETGLILPLGKAVLNKACAQAARWWSRGLTLRMSVNVSARQLADPEFCSVVETALRSHGLPPGALELEVTESTLMDHIAGHRAHLERMAACGITLAIDDFGTGYSSLAYLRDLPIGVLKLDRSFVTEVADLPRHRAIASAIIALGRNLSLQVVAEGVETPRQAAVLQALGCHQGQGHLFGRPMAAEDLPDLSEPGDALLRPSLSA